MCVCKLAGVHELAALLCQGMSAVFSLNKRFQKGVLKRLLISAGGGGARERERVGSGNTEFLLNLHMKK